MEIQTTDKNNVRFRTGRATAKNNSFFVVVECISGFSSCQNSVRKSAVPHFTDMFSLVL